MKRTSTKERGKRNATKPVYVYFITQKGKNRLKKTRAVPGTYRYHFFRTARALWILGEKGISGGTAKYLNAWIETPHVEDAEETLNNLVAKGLAKRQKLT